MFGFAGLLHKEWEDHWEEGGAAAQGRLLPHCGDDELTGEGQGGTQASFWVESDAVKDSVCQVNFVIRILELNLCKQISWPPHSIGLLLCIYANPSVCIMLVIPVNGE